MELNEYNSFSCSSEESINDELRQGWSAATVTKCRNNIALAFGTHQVQDGVSFSEPLAYHSTKGVMAWLCRKGRGKKWKENNQKWYCLKTYKLKTFDKQV